MRLWDSTDTQFCETCYLYHYRDECTCPYFNDPNNWTPELKGNKK